ncbi:MAG: hypothetical protein V3T58_04715 [Candidatus Hydrothermarchaeales archaeon]
MIDINPRRAFLFSVAVFLFILAIQAMEEGASDLGYTLKYAFNLDNPLNTLGFGWLSASLILSGSPIAASALAFFDSGVLTELEAFAMLNGARFGVSFAILLIGFIYHMRGHERHTSISLGILTLLVTYTIYLGAILIGIFILRYDLLDFLQFGIPAFLTSTIDVFFNPIVDFLAEKLGSWLVFLFGLAIIIASFKLFDGALPKVKLKETRFKETSRYIYRPWVMFSLGFILTMITPSVSISLGLLVPLSVRGYIKVENLVPYIMGANISTFSDTLVIAILLANPSAFTIVLAEIVGIAVVSAVVLAFFFHAYERFILDSLLIISRSNRNLAAFLIATFLVPIGLLLI